MFADIGGGGKYVGITARQTSLRSLALCGCGRRAQLGWGPVPLRVKRGRECLHHEVPAYNVTHEVVQYRRGMQQDRS